MKLKLLNIALAGTLLVASQSAFAGLIVTQNNNSSDLIDTIVGSGVSASNYSITGNANAFGTFSGGISAGIGIESGIMLSSGNVADAVGPNSQDNTSTNYGTAGDADLTSLSGNNTLDAAILNFDFISDGGDIFFNYVFASEEYNEYANQNVNDVFGFFLDGQNIALIPGTNTPVSINTVNGGNPYGTNAQNEQYFNNNDLQDGGPFFDIAYDGFTDVFTASFTGLSAGAHSISLRIADAGDGAYDSTVFIQAGSFSNKETNVPEPSSLILLALGALGIAGRRIKGKA